MIFLTIKRKYVKEVLRPNQWKHIHIDIHPSILPYNLKSQKFPTD